MGSGRNVEGKEEVVIPFAEMTNRKKKSPLNTGKREVVGGREGDWG